MKGPDFVRAFFIWRLWAVLLVQRLTPLGRRCCWSWQLAVVHFRY